MSTLSTGRWSWAAVLAAAVALAGSASAGGGSPFEQAQLLASGGKFGDSFGSAVAVSGGTAIVAARQDANPGLPGGSARVFVSTAGGWVEQATLLTTSSTLASGFSNSLAIDGDTVVVGAPFDGQTASLTSGVGSATVYVRTGTTWSVEAVLTPSGPPQNGALFGTALALEGDRLLVGANGTNSPANAGGAAYVFERVGGVWTETAKLVKAISQSFDNFGRHVSLSGDAALIGRVQTGFQGPDEVKGIATIFDYSGGVWTEGYEFTGPMPLQTISFGGVLDLDGDTAVFGAIGAPSALGGVHKGAAFVYERSGAAWVLTATLTGSGVGVTQQDHFGWTVAIEGDRIVVGSPWDRTPLVRAGSAYVFERVGGTWGPPLRLGETVPGPGSYFGDDVAFTGDTLMVGAPGNDTQGNGAGAAYVYRWALPPETYCTAGTSASGCAAAMSTSGSPSASASSGFSLQVTSVEGSKRGIFYWGSNGRKATPWYGGSSFQCVQPPVVRSPLLAEVGTNGNCDAAYAYDLNARWSANPGQNPGAGALVQAQFWFRDPFNTVSSPTSLSDAVEFLVCP